MRRSYLINKSFQIKFTLMAMGLLLLYSLLVGLVVYLAATNNNGALLFGSAYQTPLAGKTGLVLLIVNILILGLVFFLLTHRIAGPLYRISREIEAVSNHDYSGNVVLRREDQFKDIAAMLNAMTASLREKERNHADDLSALQETVQALARKSKSPEAATGLSKELDDCVEKIKAIREKWGRTE